MFPCTPGRPSTIERDPRLQPGLDFSAMGRVQEPGRAPGGVWAIFCTLAAAGPSETAEPWWCAGGEGVIECPPGRKWPETAYGRPSPHREPPIGASPAPLGGSGGAQDRAKRPQTWKALLGASCTIVRGAKHWGVVDVFGLVLMAKRVVYAHNPSQVESGSIRWLYCTKSGRQVHVVTGTTVTISF